MQNNNKKKKKKKKKKSAKPNNFDANFVLRKCIPTFDVFIHKEKSYKRLKFLIETVELQRKLMEKAEAIQKLIFFTSEITLLICFTTENNTF